MIEKIVCHTNPLRLGLIALKQGTNKLDTFRALDAELAHECGKKTPPPTLVDKTDKEIKRGGVMPVELSPEEFERVYNTTYINTTDRRFMAEQIAVDLKKKVREIYMFDKYHYEQTTKDRIEQLIKWAEEWAKGIKAQATTVAPPQAAAQQQPRTKENRNIDWNKFESLFKPKWTRNNSFWPTLKHDIAEIQGNTTILQVATLLYNKKEIINPYKTFSSFARALFDSLNIKEPKQLHKMPASEYTKSIFHYL